MKDWQQITAAMLTGALLAFLGCLIIAGRITL